jgi:hypothetical protein
MFTSIWAVVTVGVVCTGWHGDEGHDGTANCNEAEERSDVLQDVDCQ